MRKENKRIEGIPAALRSEWRSLTALALALFLLCCCEQSFGLNPSTQITQYGHTIWRLGQDGLDANPLSIAQTADGYIWVGTTNGLLRFDGVHFSPWAPQSGEQLRGSNILNLFGARNGSLYVGTLQSVARITNGSVFNYQSLLYHPGPFIEDAEGAVWMGDIWNLNDANTFCRVGMESLKCLGTKEGLQCLFSRALASDHPGSIWIGSDQGICHWQRGRAPERYPTASMDAMAATPDGALWAADGDEGKGHGLFTFSGGKWQSFETAGVDGTKLPGTFLLSDHHGSLWIATNGKGLYRLSEGRLDHFSKADGLSSDNVSKLLEDREGDIWVLTDRGIDTFRDLPVISYSPREGMPSDQPFAIAAQDDGTVWIGTDSGLVRLKDGVFSDLTKQGLSVGGISYLFEDGSHQLWIESGAVYVYKNGLLTKLQDPEHLDIGTVGNIVEDREHQIWASILDTVTGRGYLLQIAGTSVVKRVPLYGPTLGETPSSLAADPRGGLWGEAFQHGIFHYLEGRLESVHVQGYRGQVIELSVDPNGALWIVTQGEGVVRYKDGISRSLTKENGLPCNAGIGIVNDHAGNHWFTMSCGFIQIADSEIAAWWNDPKYKVKSRVFGVLDGAAPRLSGGVPVMTPDGRMWSENQRELQVLDTRHVVLNRVVPPVHIEKLVVDHKEVSMRGDPRLPKSPRDLEIDYSALTYPVPERVRFRYRLAGYENQWTDAGNRRQAFYNDLKPGHYTFQVIACNNDGVWNLSGAHVKFTIPPAWYQTIWFGLLCVMLAAALAYAFYQSRLRRYANLLKARFDERIEERTRLARDLHDTLLQTIQGSKLVADNALEDPTDDARMHKALDLVSQWLERASLEGRAALNSLRSSTVETNDLAAALRRAADDCCLGRSVQVISVLHGTSSDMHPIVRDEIYRIGYEAINNACIHSEGSVVTIELTYDQNVLLSVRDDGRGIDEGILKFGKSGHFGLNGMRERADRIGAKLSLKTSRDKGTEVNLLIPGTTAFRKLEPRKVSFLSQILRRFRAHKDDGY